MLRRSARFAWLAFLMVLVTGIFHKWMWSGILENADWRYIFPEKLKDGVLLFAWNADTGTGAPNYQLWQYPFNWIRSTLSCFIPSEYVDRITVFWPVIFGTPLAVFFSLTRSKVKDIIAFLGASIFTMNPYLLAIITQGHILINLAVVFLLLYLHAVRTWFKMRESVIMLFALISINLCAWTDFRIAYIALICSAILLVTELAFPRVGQKRLAVLGGYVAHGILFALSQLFWVLPSLSSGSLSSNPILTRQLFGGQYWDLLHAIAGAHPFWSGSSIEWFKYQSVPWYCWFPVLIMTISLIRIRPNRERIGFLLMFLIGAFLAKQDNAPLSRVYYWLFVHVPGFNAFRESTKFYIPVILGLTYAATDFFSPKNKLTGLRVLLFAPLLLMLFFLGQPIATGRLGSIFSSKHVPAVYQEIATYLQQNATGYRTLWVPSISRWGYFDSTRPRVGMSGFLSDELASYTKLPRNEQLTRSNVLDFLHGIHVGSILQAANIKYLVVPEDDMGSYNEDLYSPFGRTDLAGSESFRSELLSALDAVPGISRVEGVFRGALVVYELPNPLPQIFISSNIRFTDSESVQKTADFLMGTIGDQALAFVSGRTSSLPALHYSTIDNLGEKILSAIRVSGKPVITRRNMMRSQAQLYTVESSSYKIVRRVGGLALVKMRQPGITINGDGGELISEELPKTDLNPGHNLLVGIDSGLTRINREQEVELMREESAVEVYISDLKRLFSDSFERGPWQPTVGNCNKFDDNPILGMSLNRQEKTDGRQSLQLEATRHTACISTKIALPADISGEYALSFDYQSPNGQRAGYYLQFDDEKKTVVRETPSITTSTWQSYAKKLTIPAGAKNARLYLYGYSLDEQTNIITRYDNVQFGKIELVKTIEIPQEEGYEKIPVTLKEGENTFEYVDPRYDYKNLLPNPSFETRPWQEKVGDCNRYDDNPQLAMRLNEQEKTDGAKSLELEATRHAACMATTVPIKPGATYLLSFDYQSPNAKQASYYIGFNDPEKTSLKDQLAVTSTAWNTFSDTFTAPKGATSLSLYVYARETDKKTAIINRYDNFKLIEVPDLRDAFYLVSEPERKLVEPKAVDFELINPTKKLVHIKGATTPFFLGMSESYHDQWQLQFQNEKIQGVLKRWWPFAKPDRVADEYHYKLNGFLNAWYIDTDDWCAKQGTCTKNEDGSYDIEMVIEFWPQRWFYLGLLISGTTLAGCLGYLGYEGVRVIRRRLAASNKEIV